MTVLVVVLLCTFAAMKQQPPTTQNGTKGETEGSPLPLKTEDEYTKAVLAARRGCVLSALRRDSFEVKVCSYLAASTESGTSNECLGNLQKEIDGFAVAPSLESLALRYSVRFGKLYLRANTGLGSADAEALKKRLQEEQQYLKTLTTGPFARFGLLSPTYAEHGLSTLRSEVTFGVEVGLAANLIDRIDSLWESKDARGLEQLLKQSDSCVQIGR